MKIRALVDYHDTEIGEVYDVIQKPSWACEVFGSEWILDDVGDEYILLDEEYEVVDE